ncbi:MAG: glycosyltransferase family 2 protein [Anaerolineales bacterium]|nr:glycosyltransferase family 2 protein [Anaerolineales bacterium]
MPIRARTVASQVKWITPRLLSLQTDSNDLVVICVVRNGQEHLKGFIDHHRKIGAKYIVFLDNNSTDLTIELAQQQSQGDVILLKCDLQYGRYRDEFKYWLAQTFGSGCWCLIADIDERFDFPYSNLIKLSSFLQYLNSYKYSGVYLQMVDLFADKSILDWPTIENIEERSLWYDHTNIFIDPNTATRDTALGNKETNSNIKALWGGIRKAIFNVEKLQTKQTLLFPSRGAYPISPHWIKNADLADVSCALFHYAFDNTFPKRCEEIVRRNSHWSNSIEYRNYLLKINQMGDELTLKTSSAKKLSGINDLVDDGYLIVSEQYMMYVKSILNTGRT